MVSYMDNTLIYGLATLGVGFLGLVVKYSFKSKCVEVGLCCGCLTIKRNVDDELKAERMELGAIHHTDSISKISI